MLCFIKKKKRERARMCLVDAQLWCGRMGCLSGLMCQEHMKSMGDGNKERRDREGKRVGEQETKRV